MKSLSQELIETMCALNARGINQGKTGNGSIRSGDGFLITPSGVDYPELSDKELVAMSLDGRWSHPGSRRPSSEWRFHRDIYIHRPDVNAILHTHGMGVATLACARLDIPAFHYMIAIAGGNDIRCADYATFGTQELSDSACRALERRKACLLAHHGMIAVGESMEEALSVATEVEHLARVYWRVLQLGEPAILSSQQMEQVLEQFRRGYGDSDSSCD